MRRPGAALLRITTRKQSLHLCRSPQSRPPAPQRTIINRRHSSRPPLDPPGAKNFEPHRLLSTSAARAHTSEAAALPPPRVVADRSATTTTAHEQSLLTMDALATALQRLGLSGPGHDGDASLLLPPADKLPASCQPARNPVDVYRAHIAHVLAPIVGAELAVVYNAIQWTQTLDKGDAVLPVPALRVKGRKPDDVARDIDEKFPETPLVKKPIVSGNFVQFFFKPEPLTKIVLASVLQQKDKYGFNPVHGLKDPQDPSKGSKRIIVEFSSPNIAKPFHAGHLRSTIIGGFLANLHEGAGWDVVRINYLGDWGKQYGVLALGFQMFGNEEALEKNPIGHLYDVYVKINTISAEEVETIKAKKAEIALLKEKQEPTAELEAQLQKTVDESVDEAARKYFKRMSDGDKDAVALWQKFRDLSIVRYKQTYARLNISFDDYSGESTVKQSTMDMVAETLKAKGISEISEGAVLIDLTKYSKKLGKALVQKKDGTSLYLTRDISVILERAEKYRFDKMIYVVGAPQDLHFAQLFKIEEVMGHKDLADRCTHINFGSVLGMSTRKGTARFLDDILRDVGAKMHEVMKGNEGKYAQVEDPDATADVLGISAVMVQDMTGKRINNYTFDMDRMCSFEGDTGPYLQYAHARLCSILRKAQAAVPDLDVQTLEGANFELLGERHAADLVRSLAQWPDVFQNTLKTLEPVTVLTYLFRMTHALSSSYEHLQVIGSAPDLLRARLALYLCGRQVLQNGMRLLGLSPVERM